MATRTRKKWKPNSRGYYERQIGWKKTNSGNVQQHKFLLGTDLREAQRRERKLREIWDEFAGTQDDPRPIWPAGLLEIAKRVAKGAAEIAIPRKPDEMQTTYAGRIRRMQKRYPVICFVPADTHAYEVGQEALRLVDTLDLPEQSKEIVSPRVTDDDVIEAWRVAHAILEDAGLEISVRDFNSMLASATDEERKKEKSNGSARENGRANSQLAQERSSPQPSIKGSLHVAMRAFQDYVEKEWFRPELGRITPWGRTQVRQLDTLMKHHKNRPLADLNCDGVDEMIGYWRKRPLSKKSKVPTTRKSASHYVSQLRRFFDWLHKSSRFEWRKPEDYNEISVKIVDLSTDRAKNLEQVDTFSVDELVLLVRYGHPMERLLVLLGLNCGFGTAEIATLLVSEVMLREAHKPRFQEILGHKTTDEDSFIKRIRRKNGVYGEFLLFPQTVQGIEWALSRRRKQNDFSKQSQLLLNDNGEPFDKPTKSGNRNQQIPNYFARLIKRITDDDNEIRNLSFGKLRKTASDLVRRFSGGEVAGVFLCHGSAVKSDDLSDVYTNRPFGRVFEALREVQSYLTPVFDAAGPNPFDTQPQAYTSRKTIDRIIEMNGEGRTGKEIAVDAGVSQDTVRRHLDRSLRTIDLS